MKPIHEVGKYLEAKRLKEWVTQVKAKFALVPSSGARRARFERYMPSVRRFVAFWLSRDIACRNYSFVFLCYPFCIPDEAMHLLYGLFHVSAGHLRNLLCLSLDFVKFALDLESELDGKKEELELIPGREEYNFFKSSIEAWLSSAFDAS